MPEAQLGRCIRSKEKGLLDKYDGLATAAGSETRPRYYIQYRHATMNETRGISSAEHCPLRSAEGAQGTHTHTHTHTHLKAIRGKHGKTPHRKTPVPQKTQKNADRLRAHPPEASGCKPASI